MHISRGPHGTFDSILALHQAALGFILGFHKNFSLGPAALNSAQRLDNVSHTHLVLASGKLVLQKDAYIRARCNLRFYPRTYF